MEARRQGLNGRFARSAMKRYRSFFNRPVTLESGTFIPTLSCSILTPILNCNHKNEAATVGTPAATKYFS